MRDPPDLEVPAGLQKRPLAGHRLAESGDPDLVRSIVAHALGAFQLSQLSRDTAFDAHFYGLRLNSGGIYYLEYGTDVRVDPQEIGDLYLVQVPLTGRAWVSVGSRTFVSTPERASLLQGGNKASMTIDRANQHLILCLDRLSVRHALRKKLGREPIAPIVFDPQMDLTTPGNHMFHDLLMLFVNAVDSATVPSMIAMPEFEGLLLSQLILGQPSNYRDELHCGRELTGARPIARAAELIEARAHEPLTTDDIAYAVGISARALQEGFRRTYDTTPTAFLREIRLQRARTDLLQAHPTGTNVTTIALQWGFLHPGRFSVMYRRRFGETPSTTLRQKRHSSKDT